MKNKFSKFFPFLALVFGVLATAMMFLPALKYPDGETTYTGVQIITGLNIFDVGAIAKGELPFSILALLAFGLPAVAGIIGMITYDKYFISVIFFLIAAVMLFLLPVYTHINVTNFITGTSELETEWVLQAGVMIAGSLSAIGGLFSLFAISGSSKRR